MSGVSAQKEATLIYVGDPMCSWCYGFAPELKSAAAELREEVDIEIVMGGLRPYNTQKMTDLADFLKGHWEEVHERSGQQFTYDVLQKDWAYDTEPPARAFTVFRDMNPAESLAFFEDLQKTFYLDNKNMNQAETYASLARKYGLDSEEFIKKFESEVYKNRVRQDFETAAQLGIRGFPSMVLKKGDEYVLIANGYTTAAHITSTVRRIMK